MVSLVNKFAAKIEEKKGSVTEDEVNKIVVQVFPGVVFCLVIEIDLLLICSQTVQFKAYLLSVGIANPVTR